jgi:hypothetical protein
VLILDAGRDSMRTARGVVAELPRSTRLGPASGLWHVIPAVGRTSGYTVASSATSRPPTQPPDPAQARLRNRQQ